MLWILVHMEKQQISLFELDGKAQSKWRSTDPSWSNLDFTYRQRRKHRCSSSLRSRLVIKRYDSKCNTLSANFYQILTSKEVEVLNVLYIKGLRSIDFLLFLVRNVQVLIIYLTITPSMFQIASSLIIYVCTLFV